MTRMTRTGLRAATGVFLLVLPATASAAEGGGGAKEPNLLDLNIASLIWVLAIFLVLVFILYRTAWKNVLAGLNARERRIRGDIADAEAARVKAEQSLSEYNLRLSTAEGQVRDLMAKAQVDAEKIAAGVRMRAQQEAEEIKERAMKDIDAARQQALTEVYEQAANLATTVAEKILKRNLNADDQRDLVNQSLEQMTAAESAAATEPRKVIHI